MKRRCGVEIRGAHAVVTGGARGIGLASARRLAADGAAVTLWDRDREALEAARDELSAAFPALSIHVDACDITEAEAVKRALSRSVDVQGPVDILVNNAGHLAPGRLVDQPPETWMTTLNVNVNALVYLTRLVIPSMYERGRGHIVNISSAAGAIGVPKLAVYSASKWAVWGFSEALRAESRPYGVAVSSIHPSYIAQGMFAGARIQGLGRLIVPLIGSHDVVAEAIVESAIKRGRTSVKRPRSVRLAVFLRGVLPDRWFNALMRGLGVWESMSGWHGAG